MNGFIVVPFLGGLPVSDCELIQRTFSLFNFNNVIKNVYYLYTGILNTLHRDLLYNNLGC